MGRRTRRTATAGGAIAALALTMLAVPASAGAGPDDRTERVAAHWTAERMDAAQPRDLVLDARGDAYLRGADGRLHAYGHAGTAAGTPLRAEPQAKPEPGAKPGGGPGDSSDTEGPAITGLDPDGTTIGTSATFSATVTDPSGVKSVEFHVEYPPGSSPQVFRAGQSGDVWSVNLSGFSDATPQGLWRVVAKDASKGGGNTSTSDDATFTVDTGSGGGGGGGGGGGTVTNERWSAGGDVQTAAGRIFFEMPANKAQSRWNGYVCSGTVTADGTTGRSILITAAHCVYDDAYKTFARNVLFIPDQDGTSGAGTDRNCGNDPLGCWAPKWGVVDTDWTTRTFPDNIPWDYAYYVVDDSGAHSGTSAGTDVLDDAAGSLPVQFSQPTVGDVTHALGYSYSDDPYFMYCAEEMGTEGAANWWLPSCDLSGGSSGGPWVQPMSTSTGSGPIISVNSWGYSNQPGMAGPKLSGTSASCLFTAAKAATTTTEPRGIVPGGC